MYLSTMHGLHLTQVGIDEGECRLGRHVFGHPREFAHIREQHRHLLLGLLAEREVENALHVEEAQQLVRHEPPVGGLGLAQQFERVPVRGDLLLEIRHVALQLIPEPGQ
jgi:hypothetical protein